MYFTKKTGLTLLTLILMLFLLPISLAQEAENCEASGYMGKFAQGENVTITQSCPTCTFLNITITDPESNIVFTNVQMALANDIFTFGPNSTISNLTGLYNVLGISNLDNPFKSCYRITNISTEITLPEAIIYIILTFFVFFMFLIFVWGGIGLQGRNQRNELGRVIGVTVMKYVKLGSMLLAYAFFTWLINILYILSTSFVTLGQYSGFFLMMFNFLLAGLYPIFVTTIVVFFILASRDLKLVDLLGRGLQPR